MADTARYRPGALSRRGESHGLGTVSSGRHDHGGQSVGNYQINQHRVPDFLQHEGQPWADRFSGHHPGTAAFAERWREVARDEPQRLAEAEYRFIDRTHYQPQVEHIRSATGLDVTAHSRALQEVIFSTAVQFGPDSSVIIHGMQAAANHLGKTVGELTDSERITGIEAEKGRQDSHGRLVHFPDSPGMWEGLKARFRDENDAALQMLGREERAAHSEAGQHEKPLFKLHAQVDVDRDDLPAPRESSPHLELRESDDVVLGDSELQQTLEASDRPPVPAARGDDARVEPSDHDDSEDPSVETPGAPSARSLHADEPEAQDDEVIGDPVLQELGSETNDGKGDRPAGAQSRDPSPGDAESALPPKQDAASQTNADASLGQPRDAATVAMAQPAAPEATVPANQESAATAQLDRWGNAVDG